MTGRFLPLAMLGALALAACLAAPASPGRAETLALQAEPIPLHPGQADLNEVGGLIWRGGLALSAAPAGFGGLSGLLVAPDGSRLEAVSDRGLWLSLPLRYDAAGLLAGAGPGRMGRLKGPDGAPLAKRRDRDAEALARAPGGGFVVAFEHNHRLWRYPALAGTPQALAPPPGLEDAGENSAMESLAAFPKGDLLAILEGSDRAEASPAYLWRGGAWSRLTYERGGGFRPTGAAVLPDGDLVVLERRFNLLEGVRIRLVRLPAAALRPGARLRGTTIATLAPPLSLDNMEGIDARRSETGETLFYLVSDDNFNPLQRTLLMVFALKE